MNENYQIALNGEKLLLSAGRVVYWESQRSLILSDLHLGKGGHFRKAGIPIPKQVQEGDLGRLDRLLLEFDPETLIVVGDMFHSYENNDVLHFQRWRESHSQRNIILVKGNHDILKQARYLEIGVELEQDGFTMGGFTFTHQPLTAPGNGSFSISGHLHPGVQLQGIGRQRLRFPCFWISGEGLVLPAFSAFTGLFIVQPQTGEKIIAIVEGELIPF